jgi:glycine/D-amino acid oxidase-like deaminating enzyme
LHVDVLGGGAFGCSAALSLAKRGHEVRLFDREQLGAGGTIRAAGILSTLAGWDHEEYGLIAQTRESLKALSAAQGETRGAAAWQAHPSILIATRQNDGRVKELAQRHRIHGSRVIQLDAGDARDRFPGLKVAEDEIVAVAPEDGVIFPDRFVRLLRGALTRYGVAVSEGVDGTKLPRTANGHVVVVAGGAWTRRLLEANGVRVPVVSYRSHVAAVKLPKAWSWPMVNDTVNHYATRPDGEASAYFCDGTRLADHEPEPYPDAPDASFVEKATERFSKRVKPVGTVTKGWAGLLVGTPDRKALCGSIPKRPGLFVLTGDNGFGLSRALALGERMADAVEGTETPSLAPARFGSNPNIEFKPQEGFHWTS